MKVRMPVAGDSFNPSRLDMVLTIKAVDDVDKTVELQINDGALLVLEYQSLLRILTAMESAHTKISFVLAHALTKSDIAFTRYTKTLGDITTLRLVTHLDIDFYDTLDGDLKIRTIGVDITTFTAAIRALF